MQTSVSSFPVMEPALDHSEDVLNFGSDGGLFPLAAPDLPFGTSRSVFDWEGRRLILYRIFLPFLFRNCGTSVISILACLLATAIPLRSIAGMSIVDSIETVE